jgi:hypothetical protein
MYAQMQDLMERRMTMLMAGQLHELAQEYLYPLPIYIGGRQQVMHDICEMESALRRLQTISAGAGVARSETLVTAMELPRQNGFRVWVTYRYFGADGAAMGEGQYVHYCRLTEAGIKTEMSEFSQCFTDWAGTETRRARA